MTWINDGVPERYPITPERLVCWHDCDLCHVKGCDCQPTAEDIARREAEEETNDKG